MGVHKIAHVCRGASGFDVVQPTESTNDLPMEDWLEKFVIIFIEKGVTVRIIWSSISGRTIIITFIGIRVSRFVLVI